MFGQYGEFGEGLEKLLDELAVLGAPQAAERYLLESSVAAVGVQKRLLQQRLVCWRVAQAQADVLLSRLHYFLPGWEAAERRRRRAERGEWQEAARAWGLAWDERGTDSSEFEEPWGACH